MQINLSRTYILQFIKDFLLYSIGFLLVLEISTFIPNILHISSVKDLFTFAFSLSALIALCNCLCFFIHSKLLKSFIIKNLQKGAKIPFYLFLIPMFVNILSSLVLYILLLTLVFNEVIYFESFSYVIISYIAMKIFTSQIESIINKRRKKVREDEKQ